MFDKVYKAYLDLDANTKRHIFLVIENDNAYLTVDMHNLVYVGAMSARGAGLAYDMIRNFEILFAEIYAEWNL
jgi:hypothetical protein